MKYYLLFVLMVFSMNACASVSEDFDDERDDIELIKFDEELFNSLEIDLNFTDVVKHLNEAFDRKSMGKRDEKTFINSLLNAMYKGDEPTFSIDKISAIEMDKKYVEYHKEHYRCSNLKLCYVSVLWYDGLRVSQSYKFKNKKPRMQGDFEVVISASELTKTRITIIGHDLALKLGKKCCSRRTFQPYENLFMIKNDLIEQYRILMYFMDFLDVKNIN